MEAIEEIRSLSFREAKKRYEPHNLRTGYHEPVLRRHFIEMILNMELGIKRPLASLLADGYAIEITHCTQPSKMKGQWDWERSDSPYTQTLPSIMDNGNIVFIGKPGIMKHIDRDSPSYNGHAMTDLQY